MQKKSYTLRSESGQMIIGVIVALGVIMFTLLGAVIATTRALKTVRVSNNQAGALSYANNTIEAIKFEKSNDVNAFFNRTNCNDFDNVIDIYTITVNCVGFSGDLVDVSVSVSWAESDSTLSVVLETKLAKVSY